jgi:hypothetical protein
MVLFFKAFEVALGVPSAAQPFFGHESRLSAHGSAATDTPYSPIVMLIKIMMKACLNMFRL